MAVTPIYELNVPAPYDELVIYGEKALSVAPTINGAAPRTNYHLAVWAWLEGGEYTLRMIAENTSSWSTSITKSNARVFLYTPRGAGPVIRTIFLPRGKQRIDLLLSNVAAVAGPCYIAFSLHRQGRLAYSSNGTGWVFSEEGPIEDNEIPNYDFDARLNMPVFATPPNWQNGVIERFAYATETMPSESLTEQRRALRVAPRRWFEMEYLRTAENRTRIDSFLSGTGRNEFMLPLWHEQYVLPSTLSNAVTFPEGTLRAREFRTGMLCLVTLKDPKTFEVLTITDHDENTDTIEFSGIPVGSWPAGARLVPLRTARVMDVTKVSNHTDKIASTTIRFQLADSESLWYTPSWYGTSLLFTFTPNRVDAIDVDYDRPTAYIQQEDFGPLDVYDSDQKSQLAWMVRLMFKSRDSLLAFRRFVDKTRGRSIRFWSPSFATDLELLSDVTDDSFDVRRIGFTDYFKSLQEHRLSVMIQTSDSAIGTVYLDIVDVSLIDANTERFLLAVPRDIGGEIPRSVVTKVQWLSVVRFDQDTFEIQHEVAGSAASTMALTLRTTDRAGLGLPGSTFDTVFTSGIYPLEVVEEMDAVIVQHAGGYQAPYTVEALDVSTVPLDGDMATVVKSIAFDPEALDVSTVPLDGDMPTVVKSITADPDAIDVSNTVDVFTLVTVLVPITYPADAIDVSTSMLGGTLV